MRVRRGRRLRSACVWLAAGPLVVACGDDPAGPGGGGGGAGGAAGDLAAALEDAADALASNQASLASVDFFTPFIGLSLAPAPAPTPQAFAGARPPCFADVAGTTFDFDFGSGAYVATGLTGAPANGVRFLLYPLDGSGNPQPGSSLGHLDLTCDSSPTTNPAAFDIVFGTSLVSNDATIIETAMGGTINLDQDRATIFGTGTFASADGSFVLPFEGGPGNRLSALDGGLMFSLGNSVTAGFGRLDSGGGAFGVAVNANRTVPGEQLFDWNFQLFAEGSAEQLATSQLTLDDPDIGSGTFACVQGPFSGPSVSAASDCTPSGEFVIPGVGAAERQAVAAAYGTLYGLWDSLIGFLDGGLALVAEALAPA
jgi:hypothetical protein